MGQCFPRFCRFHRCAGFLNHSPARFFKNFHVSQIAQPFSSVSIVPKTCVGSKSHYLALIFVSLHFHVLVDPRPPTALFHHTGFHYFAQIQCQTTPFLTPGSSSKVKSHISVKFCESQVSFFCSHFCCWVIGVVGRFSRFARHIKAPRSVYDLVGVEITFLFSHSGLSVAHIFRALRVRILFGHYFCLCPFRFPSFGG